MCNLRYTVISLAFAFLAVHVAVAGAVAAGDEMDAFSLDVGASADKSYLGYGWSSGEKNPERTFRWIKQLEADATLEISDATLSVGSNEFHLRILAAAFFVEGRQQNVGVFLNNKYVGEWVCEADPDFHTYRLQLPREHLHAGKNRLTLRMGYRQKPHRGDKRQLALAVDHIVVEQGNGPEAAPR